MSFWIRADTPPEDRAIVLTATLANGHWLLAIGKWEGCAWWHHLQPGKTMWPQPHLWSILYPPLDGHREIAESVQAARDEINNRPYYGPSETD